jgi:predicted membrane protein
MWVNIKNILVSSKQLKKVDRHKVEQHKIHLEKGGEMLPIDVVKINETDFCICGNGRHRYFGAMEAGFNHIEVNILNGE